MRKLRELFIVLCLIIVPRKRITVIQKVASSKNFDFSSDFQLISSQEILCIGLAWLVKSELEWKFLSSEGNREGVLARVGRVDFSDLDGVISQEEMDYVVTIVAFSEEFEHPPVIFQELLFGYNSPPTQLLLKIILHDCILDWNKLGCRFLNPLIAQVILGRTLRVAKLFIELPGVLVTVHKANRLAVNVHDIADSEILRHEELAIFINCLFPLQEDTLRDTRVFLLFLVDRYGVILKIEADDELNRAWLTFRIL